MVSVEADARPAAAPELSGRDAVRRVFEVVAGFDSAVIAEEQLLGQVRGAYEAALAAGTTGPTLNELFRQALRFGRRVRTHARPGTDRSLADPGLAWVRERLAPGSRVVVAGTGEMGRLAASGLARAGHAVTIVSTSAERGGRLLEQLPGDGHHLVVGPVPAALLAEAGAVVLAVRSRAPILDRSSLGGARPWVLDLSSPSAVAPEAATVLGDRLITVDHLGELASSAPVLAPGTERRLRIELDQEVDAFATWLGARRGADALAALHGEAESVRRRHLARLRRRGGLDPEQLDAVEAAAAAMLGELLHGPSIELRRGGADAETVRRLFRLGS
jgi:glutamyl-tRNA reductase